jgi:hypothetical protein
MQSVPTRAFPEPSKHTIMPSATSALNSRARRSPAPFGLPIISSDLLDHNVHRPRAHLFIVEVVFLRQDAFINTFFCSVVPPAVARMKQVRKFVPAQRVGGSFTPFPGQFIGVRAAQELAMWRRHRCISSVAPLLMSKTLHVER